MPFSPEMASAIVYGQPQPQPGASKKAPKKASEAARRNFRKKGLLKFTRAVQAPREAHGVQGFLAVGGKPVNGQTF